MSTDWLTQCQGETKFPITADINAKCYGECHVPTGFSYLERSGPMENNGILFQLKFVTWSLRELIIQNSVPPLRAVGESERKKF